MVGEVVGVVKPVDCEACEFDAECEALLAVFLLLEAGLK